MSLIFRHTLIRLRAATVRDRHGNDVTDWGDPVETSLPGWAVDAGDTTQNRDGRDGTTVSYTARGPYTADVVTTDRIRFAGDVYEITGGVLRQPGPTARTAHTIFRLTRAEG